MSAELAGLFRARVGWSAERIALFDAAFSRYWSRSTALARYLYEFQYLGPGLGSDLIADPRAFFLDSTSVDADFLAASVLDGTRFDALAAGARLCACYAVDERRFRRAVD